MKSTMFLMFPLFPFFSLKEAESKEEGSKALPTRARGVRVRVRAHAQCSEKLGKHRKQRQHPQHPQPAKFRRQEAPA